MYLFFTYVHERNNATLTYFRKFMSISQNSYAILSQIVAPGGQDQFLSGSYNLKYQNVKFKFIYQIEIG